MTEARYILRFDDICPTMNWAVWDEIEKHLRFHNVCPILAVIPDNQDPTLAIDPPRADFWEWLRRLQDSGYCIALHGHQHLYINQRSGLMRLTEQSEFVGLTRTEQERKLGQALAVFRKYGVNADAWVAPSHSFDQTTLKVLSDLGIPVVSDGLCRWPYTDSLGLIWVPQQLWKFEPRPKGIWTVCQHHNEWTGADLKRFVQDLELYAHRMNTIAEVVEAYSTRRFTLTDQMTAMGDWLLNHRIPRELKRIKSAIL